jgi:hypothetical protein
MAMVADLSASAKAGALQGTVSFLRPIAHAQ